MSVQIYKKGIIVCRIIFGLGVILFLIAVIGSIKIENWNDNVSSVLRVFNEVSRYLVVISLVVWAILSIKIKEQKKKIE